MKARVSTREPNAVVYGAFNDLGVGGLCAIVDAAGDDRRWTHRAVHTVDVFRGAEDDGSAR